jgi:hypothetical protein
MIKYLLIFVILFSSSIAEGHGNKRWKKGHKKKYRNNKHKIHKVVYRSKPSIKINYGYHGYLRPWRYLYPRHNHNNVVVIKNEEKVLDNSSDVFAKIEQLGALKESGLITEKEFQKAKKELLKRI